MAFSQLERRSLEALRYRGEDILRSLNKQVVREVRLALPEAAPFGAAAAPRSIPCPEEGSREKNMYMYLHVCIYQ